jgi:threonine dehydrogenase-like Zn-dependent dehydrogenase
MKALLYEAPHQMRVINLPAPSPAGGEVVLRVGACGICGSDVHGYTGESGRRSPGQVMGHEFAGTIAALGTGVAGWEVGQRVVAYNIIGCGNCHYCGAGNEQCCPHRKVIGVNTGTNGAFAEFVSVPARNLIRLSDKLPFPLALFNEPLAVSYHALQFISKEARTLAIIGGGTIGQCLVRVARLLPGRDVFLLEPVSEKRALAESNGAKALPPDVAQLLDLAPGGTDAAVEAVGSEESVRLAINAVRPGGRVVLLGNLAKEVRVPLQQLISEEKQLVGSYGFNFRDFHVVVGWLNEGKLDMSLMLSGRCTLDEAPQVFADLAAGRRQAVKMVVVP